MSRSLLLGSLLLAASLAAQPAPKSESPRKFSSQVVLIIDADEAIKERVSRALESEFSKLAGAEVTLFSPEWKGAPDWVVSISATVAPDAKGEPSFQMGFAFSQAFHVIDVRFLRGKMGLYSTMPVLDLERILDDSMVGVSDFKGMWMTHGSLSRELERSCRDAAATFDENFLRPQRRQWEKRQRREAQQRSRNRRR